MKGIRPLLLLACLLGAELSFGQISKVDSLRTDLAKAKTPIAKLAVLNLLSKEFLQASPDSALYYAEQQLTLAKRSGVELQLAKATASRATAIARKGNDSLAIELYLAALKYKLPKKEIRFQASLHQQMGRAYYHLANYDLALNSFYKALALQEGDSMKIDRASTLNSIGNVFYFTSKSEAVGYYEQSLKIHQSMGNLEGIASQLGNLGLIYLSEKNYKKGIEYSEQSLQHYRKLGNERSIARSEVNLALAYKEAGNTDKALPHAKESLLIASKLKDKRGIATATIMIGNIYLKMNDCKVAIGYYEPGVALMKELGMRSYEWETSYFLAQCYMKVGQKDKALELFPRAIEMRDSIYEGEMKSLITEKDAKYQTLQKEGQIKLLTAEAEVSELKLRKRETYLLAASIITFLLGIVSLVVFFFYRVRTKANVILEKKNSEISAQNLLIEEKNLHITDSIRYAERLQAAILPKDEAFKKHFKQSHILYRPKDIVSGDFYWMETVGERVFLAVADCTGHGVPGAMVSMVGFQGLNKAVLEEKLTSPAQILQRLSDHIEEAFEKSGGTVKDGMDICLVAIDTRTRTVNYAGAHNALWVLSSKEDLPNANLREEQDGKRMFELKADRRSIGGFMDAGTFTEAQFQLNAGDQLFLFSDGFADQFGGPDGKKMGSKRMRETVREMALAGKLSALGTIFEDWKGTEEQVDDVTVISVMV